GLGGGVGGGWGGEGRLGRGRDAGPRGPAVQELVRHGRPRGAGRGRQDPRRRGRAAPPGGEDGHGLMLAISYNWWKFLHVAGVIAFVMFHGVSMIVAFRLRKERDRGKIAAMTQLSGSSVTGMYVSLVWLIVFGVIAGIQG